MSEPAEQEAPPESFALFAKAPQGRTRSSTLEPTLHRINDRFARFLRAALLQHLRRAVTIVPTGSELVEHRDLMDRLPSPIYLSLFTMRPLRGTLVLMIEAPLVVAIVESRFGGNGRFPINIANRDFTPFELKSMRRVVETALEQFIAAWEPVGRFDIETVRHETNPQFASFATAEDQVLVSGFDISVDHGKGRMETYIPFATVQPLHDQMVSGIVADMVDHDLRWSETLRASVGEAEITLDARLGTIEISVRDLMALRPGCVFEMDRPETIVVEAHGVPLFRGRWGRHGSKIGVVVEERLSSSPADHAGQTGDRAEDR
ncbi:MAG: flagellar motor switch protein FliM [Alphaproteobacteria bacterium]|nr:flagellar motor switch protein FliM [Alphaproteobacteria bacterium]MBV9553002.1 flagellar motor switch protein FliM [Alphaproteobacteria bacterium]